jgi:hypothetical protein
MILTVNFELIRRNFIQACPEEYFLPKLLFLLVVPSWTIA